MEQRQQKAALVLKYGKRRFDGGSEMDLIRVIERQQDIDQLNKLYNPKKAESMNFGVAAPLTLAPEQSVKTKESTAKSPEAKRVPLNDVLIRGPLQICIGLVGILTAGLAIVTFSRQGNDLMLQQSQLVFGECVKSLRKGIWDTLLLPVSIAKTLLRKA